MLGFGGSALGAAGTSDGTSNDRNNDRNYRRRRRCRGRSRQNRWLERRLRSRSHLGLGVRFGYIRENRRPHLPRVLFRDSRSLGWWLWPRPGRCARAIAALLMSSEIRPTRGSKESRTLVSSAVSSACVASGSFPSSTNVRIVSSSFSCFLLFSRDLNSTSAELNSWVTAVSGPSVTSVCFASSMASLNFSRLILTLMSRIRCSMALRV